MTAKNPVSVFVRFVMLVALALAAPKITAVDPPAPVVYLLAVDPDAAEAGADTALFLVIRTGPTNSPLTVQYEVAGTAQNGIDYQTLSGSVTIPAGEYIADIVLTPIDDSLVEGGETVLVGLEQPLVLPPPYIVAWPSIGIAAIEDNDRDATNHPPSVALVNLPDGSVFIAPADITLGARAWDRDGRVHHVEFFEGTHSLGIVTNRSRLIAREFSLAISAAEANLDITPDEFPDFRLNPIPSDPAVLPGNLFRLLWEDVPPGHYVLTAVATDNDGAQTRSEPVEIRVTEQPPQPVVNVIAADPVAAEGPSPGDRADVIDTATFVVRRSGNTNIPLTVYYRLSGTASNGADYEMLPHSVTIPAGERGARVVVVPIDDHLVEGTESIVLTIVPPVCIAIFPPPPDCYIAGRHDAARAVIRDNDPRPTNDPPKVEIVRPLDGTVFPAPADIAIIAHAQDADGRVVTVEFFEGTNSLGIVTNNANTITSIRPPFMLAWSNVPPGHYVLSAVVTDDDGAASPSRPVEIKVAERTIQPIVNIVATDAEVSEGDGLNDASNSSTARNTATFKVSRSGPTTLPLLVHYTLDGTASNGVDYRRLTGEVSVPIGASSANIVVHPIDDLLAEGSETVIAVLTPLLCAAVHPSPDCYIVGANERALATIYDRDFNQLPKVEIIAPADGTAFPALADIAIDVVTRDPDGYVTKVEFFADTRRIGVDERIFIIAPPPGQEQKFSMVWSNVLPGEYKLTAKATDDRGGMTISNDVKIVVREHLPPTLVSIEAVDTTATEQSPILAVVPDTALFIVSRTGETNRPLVVYYNVSGTASNGVDYQRLAGEVEIPAGASSARIRILAIDDNLVEPTETVVLTVEPPICIATDPAPPGCYVVGNPGHDTAYIHDDVAPNRPPTVALISPPDGSVFAAPADIWLIARASDSDGYVRTVEFFEGSNSLGSVTNYPILIEPPHPVGGGTSAAGDPATVFAEDELEALLHPIPLNPFRLLWQDVRPGHYLLTAVATDNLGASTRSEVVEIKVVERPQQPVVTVTARDPKASEGPLHVDSANAARDTALFIVKRTGPTRDALTVHYRLSGTASNGVDYDELPNTVTIPAGSSYAPVVVNPIDDNLVEGRESVVITIVEPICIAIFPPPPDCYAVGRNHSARAVIYDNDSPSNRPPVVRIITPEDGQAFLAPADIQIDAKAADSDGFVRTVEFFEGTNSLGIVRNGLASTSREAQLFTLNWEGVPAGHYVLTTVATDNDGETAESEPIEIKVVERHEPTVVNIVARDPEAREISPLLDIPEDPAWFVVTRSGGETNRPLTVHYRVGGTASNGIDYIALPGTVTIPANALSADIFVEVIDDRLCEGDESVLISLVSGPCIAIFPPLRDCYLVGSNRAARAVIHDDESCPTNVPPRIAITSPHSGAVFNTPANIHIMAQTLDPDGWVPQVEFFEGSNSLGIVTMNFIVEPPPGQVQTFDLRWTDVMAGNYILTAVATDSNGKTARSEPVRISVVSPPAIPTVTIVARDPYAREGNPTNTAVFSIRRDCCTNSALTVWYSIGGTASNGVDYPSLGNSVTIPAGQRSTSIVIAPVDDRRPEPIETIVLQLQEPPTGSPVLTYHIGKPDAAAAIIVDNDQPAPVSQRLADGLVHLRMSAADGFCYRVEASTDLVNWEVVCRNTVRGNALHFVEPHGRELPRRFYRVVPDVCDDAE